VNDKIKILSTPDQVIVHVVAVKEEAAPAAGAPAAGEAAAPAEPEVVKKGKKEEEQPAE
jgi:large subunit ribosomal protein L25